MGEEITTIYIAGTSLIVFVILALFAFVYIHHLRMHRIKLQLRANELQKKQEILHALETGEARERRRLSEELHDGVGVQLTAIKYGLEHLESSVIAKPNENEALKQNIESLNIAINEIREISQNLQPELLNRKGLSLALTDLVRQLNARNKTHFNLHLENLDGIPATLTHTLFRITGELLTNVLKHSGASEASAQLTEMENTVLIIVEDNGKGMQEDQQQTGIGLLNLQSRVNELQGKLSIDSSHKGTTVIVEIPNHIV